MLGRFFGGSGADEEEDVEVGVDDEKTIATSLLQGQQGTKGYDSSGITISRRETRITTPTISELVPPYANERVFMSDLNSFPIPSPYPAKNNNRQHRSDKPWSFLQALCYFRGTVIESISLQLLLSIFLTLAIKISQEQLGVSLQVNSRMYSIHAVLGSVLGFVTVFRMNRSYDSYIEGRKLISSLVNDLRMLVVEMYISDPSDGKVETRQQICAYAEDFRRRANLLFAFIRQSVRESTEGFCPNSSLADKPFDEDSFVLDPTRPRLVDVLTVVEFQKYKTMRVNARPVYLINEMKILALRIAGLTKTVNMKLNVDPQFQDILSNWNGMTRIVDMSIPFAYYHVVNLLTFIFVYMAPFLYTTPGDYLGFQDLILLSSILLGIAFFGLEEMARRVSHPFGWDAEDHDFETFGILLNLDGEEMARQAGILEPLEFMSLPLFEDLPPKLQSSSYKRYASGNSINLEGTGGK